MKLRQLVISMVASVTMAGLAHAQTVSIGTNPQGSLAYSIGSAVAKAAIEKGNVRMRVVPQGGPTVTIPLVNAGELDFSISNSVVASFAPEGNEMFSRPNENLRAVASLVPLYSGFIVRDDSGIHSLKDLEGKRVASDYLKQKVVGINASAVLNTVGMNFDDVDAVPVPNGLRGVEDLEGGNVDATFFSISSGRTQQADAATGGVRVIPVENSSESIEKLRAIAPTSSVEMIKPGPNMTGIDNEQGIFKAEFILLVSSSVSDDVVYTVTKALYENKDSLVSSAKVFESFDPERMANYDGVQLHPGAKKFYQEQDLLN